MKNWIGNLVGILVVIGILYNLYDKISPDNLFMKSAFLIGIFGFFLHQFLFGKDEESYTSSAHESLIKAKKHFFIALSIDIYFNFVIGFNSFSLLSKFKQVQQGIGKLDRSILNIAEYTDLFVILSILTTFCVALALVIWLKACYKFAKMELGATDFKYENWTFAGWLIPILNLVRPYQVINEIYKSGKPRYEGIDNQNKGYGSTFILSWWIFWICMHFIMLILGNETRKLSHNIQLTITDGIWGMSIYVGYSLISIFVALMWYLIVAGLTQRLLGRGITKTNTY